MKTHFSPIAWALLFVAICDAQITPVGPFVGDHSETWEEFGVNNLLAEGTSILGGIATISETTEMVTAKTFIMCTVSAKPSDGMILMDSDRPAGPFTISFSQPVSAFGAYWGDGLHCERCCPFGDAAIILTFYDVAGNVVGSDSFIYTGNGTLMWRGYQFSRPVKTIVRTASDGEEGFAVDGLQAVVASNPAQLYDISTRSFVETGDDVMIGGFVIIGSGQKQVLLRALGPTLSQPPFNLSNTLADPVLELHMPDGSVVTNDNWQQAANAGSIPPNLQPPNPSESAILISLAPASYTAIVRGVNNTTGNALVEAYDLNNSGSFSNISTRGFVQTSDAVLIAGVIVNGAGSKDVLLRALGPTLGQSPFNVPNVLTDPFLDLRDSNGTRITANDNWQDSQAAEIQATGRAPPNPVESAIVISLQSGSYTAIVTGINGATGNGLVEVYSLN